MEATTSTATDRQAEAVALRDAGKSNKEIGEAMGITPGAAGNLVVNGLRAMGRESEVGGNGGGGGRTAKPPSALDAIDEAIARVESSVERASNRVTSAQERLDEFNADTDAWVNRERERLEAEVSKAVDARDAAQETVSDEVEKLRAVRESLVD